MAHGKIAAVYVCAVVLVLCFLPVHYSLWSKFPLWYHAAFLITLVPLVLSGAAVQRRRRPSVPHK